MSNRRLSTQYTNADDGFIKQKAWIQLGAVRIDRCKEKALGNARRKEVLSLYNLLGRIADSIGQLRHLVTP